MISCHGCLAEPGSSGWGWRQLLKKGGSISAAWVERGYHPDYRLCWQPSLKPGQVIFCPFVSPPSISMFNIMTEGFLLHPWAWHRGTLDSAGTAVGDKNIDVFSVFYTSLTCRRKPCFSVSVYVICWCLVSACTCSHPCHKVSKYSKKLFP